MKASLTAEGNARYSKSNAQKEYAKLLKHKRQAGHEYQSLVHFDSFKGEGVSGLRLKTSHRFWVDMATAFLHKLAEPKLEAGVASAVPWVSDNLFLEETNAGKHRQHLDWKRA